MTVENMPDERLIIFYENIRQQVDADRPHAQKLTSVPTVRRYAEQLPGELTTPRRSFGPSYPMIRSDRQPVRGGHMSDRSEAIRRLVEIRRKPKRNRDSAAC